MLEMNNLYYLIVYLFYYQASLIILSVGLMLEKNNNKKNTKYEIHYIVTGLLLLSGLPPLPTFFIKCNILFLISSVFSKYLVVTILLLFFYYWLVILTVLFKFLSLEFINSVFSVCFKKIKLKTNVYSILFILSFFYMIEIFIFF